MSINKNITLKRPNSTDKKLTHWHVIHVILFAKMRTCHFDLFFRIIQHFSFLLLFFSFLFFFTKKKSPTNTISGRDELESKKRAQDSPNNWRTVWEASQEQRSIKKEIFIIKIVRARVETNAPFHCKIHHR